MTERRTKLSANAPRLCDLAEPGRCYASFLLPLSLSAPSGQRHRAVGVGKLTVHKEAHLLHGLQRQQRPLQRVNGQRQRRRESPWEELPDRPAEERDEARALWEAVGQLPPPQRTVIHLHYGEGYATGEIAAILRVPAATVRTRLYRGREKLRELLGGDYEL